jgi:hypothetical protein
MGDGWDSRWCECEVGVVEDVQWMTQFIEGRDMGASEPSWEGFIGDAFIGDCSVSYAEPSSLSKRFDHDKSEGGFRRLRPSRTRDEPSIRRRHGNRQATSRS